MQLQRRIRALERTTRARFTSWLRHTTDAELKAYRAHYPPNPELEAEVATWTDEQLEAARRGVPLAIVRAMQHPVT
jgi:hypothetical protein